VVVMVMVMVREWFLISPTISPLHSRFSNLAEDVT
jgi:hypothetical protein